MSLFKSLYNKLPHPEKWGFWIAVSLFIKTLFFVYFISLSYSLGPDYAGFNYKGSWAKAGGDASSYLEPIENLLFYGEYYDDYRMPGYGWLYFLFRLFFSQSTSLNFLISIQLLLSSVSVYMLALIALKIFEKKVYFYFSFLLYLTSIFVSVNDFVLMTESFATSCLIISLYFFVTSSQKNSLKYLFFSGLFLTWCIFLKPIIFPILSFLVVLLLVRGIKNRKYLLVSKRILLFVIPFLFFESLWVYRNLKKHDRFFLFQKSIYYAGYETGFRGSLYSFTKSFGGNNEFWLPNAEIIYFEPESPYFFNEEGKDSSLRLLSNNIFTKSFNKDSLLYLRQLIIQMNDSSISHNDRYLLEGNIINKLHKYKTSIKNERPFLYYIGSKLKALKKMIFNSDFGFGYVWKDGCNYYFYKICKLFYAFYYYCVIILGLIGFIFLAFKYMINYKNKYYPLLIFISYLTFAYPLIFNESQNRYFVSVYPFLILTVMYFILWIKIIVNKLKN